MLHKWWTIPLTVARFVSLRSSSSHPGGPDYHTLSLLDEFARLVTRLRATSRRNEKLAIIKEHPRTHALLRELAHEAPLHLGQKSVALAMTDGGGIENEEDAGQGSNREDVAKSITNVPSSSEDSVTETLIRLRSQELKGGRAIQQIRRLMMDYPQHRELLRDLFERRLKFGMGERLLERALDEATNEGGEQQEIMLTRGSPEHARHVTPALPPRRSSPKLFPITSKDLPVALGFPLQHPSVRLKPEPGVLWLMSRKLDGIRCLARVDRNDDRTETETETETKEKVANVTLYSRAGKVLDHLRGIRQEIRELANTLYRLYPDLKTFYLDGELCILKPSHTNGTSVSASSTNITGSPSSLTTDGGLASTGTDDFRTTLSIVLSRPTEGLHIDAHRLSYFLFDLIDVAALERVSLSGRLARLKTAMAQCERDIAHRRVQLLPQHCTDDPLSFKALLSEHWEGLIIRRDAPHLAKRTRDIIKVKDFYEAEFTIVDWRIEPMTVIREGRHMEEALLAAIKIKLAGNDVWVGSGLTQEERRRYAINPESLLGAQVTVRYFQESSNRKNDQARSLRFPTIKSIHLGEGRTV